MLTANWDAEKKDEEDLTPIFYKKGARQCYYTHGGRVYNVSVCVESGAPGEWHTQKFNLDKDSPTFLEENGD